MGGKVSALRGVLILELSLVSVVPPPSFVVKLEMRLDEETGSGAQSFVMSVIFHTVFHTAHNISRWCCHSIYISISWAGSESFLWSSGQDAASLQGLVTLVEDICRVNILSI